MGSGDPPPPLTSSKLWRAERVKERALAWCGKHAWTLALPFVALGVIGGWLPTDLRVLGLVLGLELAVFMTPLVMIASLAASYFAGAQRWGPSEARLDEHGLHLGGHSIPNRDLATAWSITSEELEVITHGGDELRLVFQDPEEAAAFGARIRAAADRSRSWTLTSGGHVSRLLRKVVGSFVPLAFAGLIAGTTPWLLPALPLGAGIAFVVARGRRRVRFGADGFTIEGRFRKRYVPYREVAGVVTVVQGMGNAVYVTLEDGSKLPVLSGMAQVRARLVHALIEEGAAMVERGEEAGAALSVLGGAASEEELLERLLGGTQTARYRDAAVEPERLAQLIRNPAAPPEHRIAAAIALREVPGGRAKIRVAADVTDEPEVRGALEDLAEEALDEARGRAIVKRLIH